MSANLNSVHLIGTLTRDVTLKYTGKGIAIGEIDIAINSKRKNAAHEWVESVVFVNCTVFGKTAENTAQYVKKGHSIFIQGRLNLSEWEDKQTKQKRSKLGVIAEAVQFLGAPQGHGGGSPQRQQSRPQGRPDPAAQADGGDSGYQEDPNDQVPF